VVELMPRELNPNITIIENYTTMSADKEGYLRVVDKVVASTVDTGLKSPGISGPEVL
jgi:hypothetical protein